MRLYEVAYACHLYTILAGFDSAIEEFRQCTQPAVDLQKAAHRQALLVWLNKWGCRQFAKKYHQLASRELLDWGRRYLARLPAEPCQLRALDQATINAAAEAYSNLMGRQASIRRRGRKSWSVTFGPTGAAKILHALRPHAFAPWDDRIREYLGYDGSAESYRTFLGALQAEIGSLEEDAAALGVRSEGIASAVGRPASSLPKLVDEYYWVTITKGFPLPKAEELARWGLWAQGSRAR